MITMYIEVNYTSADVKRSHVVMFYYSELTGRKIEFRNYCTSKDPHELIRSITQEYSSKYNLVFNR